MIYTAEHADLDAAVTASCWTITDPDQAADADYRAIYAYATEQDWELPRATVDTPGGAA